MFGDQPESGEVGVRAVLEPLKGKYYESKMTVVLEDGREVEITLASRDPRPSAREIEQDEKYFMPVRIGGEGGPWDDHYERQATFLVASEILKHFDTGADGEET
jgi:hypothetical protein